VLNDAEYDGGRGRVGRGWFAVGRGVVKITVSLGKIVAMILFDGLLFLGKIIMVIIVKAARGFAFLGLVFLGCVQWAMSFWKSVRPLLELDL
jgi:hypothetical protein